LAGTGSRARRRTARVALIGAGVVVGIGAVLLPHHHADSPTVGLPMAAIPSAGDSAAAPTVPTASVALAQFPTLPPVGGGPAKAAAPAVGSTSTPGAPTLPGTAPASIPTPVQTQTSSAQNGWPSLSPAPVPQPSGTAAGPGSPKPAVSDSVAPPTGGPASSGQPTTRGPSPSPSPTSGQW
jgi:hypothetical protein